MERVCDNKRTLRISTVDGLEEWRPCTTVTTDLPEGNHETRIQEGSLKSKDLCPTLSRAFEMFKTIREDDQNSVKTVRRSPLGCTIWSPIRLHRCLKAFLLATVFKLRKKS